MKDVNGDGVVEIEYQIQPGIDPVMKCMTQHANFSLESSSQQQQDVHKELDPQSRECDDDEDFVPRLKIKPLESPVNHLNTPCDQSCVQACNQNSLIVLTNAAF